jgi:hypothetical protein
MWKAFPNEPPIKRFVRGHIYQVSNAVLEFRLSKEGYYVFNRVAVKSCYPILPVIDFPEYLLKKHLIKELKVEDLPLYISWNTYPRFVELLKGEPHKTRTFSKSSIVISRRQEYESKRIVMELKSVK